MLAFFNHFGAAVECSLISCAKLRLKYGAAGKTAYDCWRNRDWRNRGRADAPITPEFVCSVTMARTWRGYFDAWTFDCAGGSDNLIVKMTATSAGLIRPC